jgi:hypothetical protein
VGKLMVGGTRFFLLCALLLTMPAIAASQCISAFTVQRVWTQDAGGKIKTTFSPGETIQFAALLSNLYGGSGGTSLTITTSFYNDSKTVNLPLGVSTQTWNATAPSGQGDYTITVKVLDRFCGVWQEGRASFTLGQSSLPPGPAFLPPGWYRNSKPPIIYEDRSGLRIVWGNSYVYQYPGKDPLYWYAQVIYLNTGNQNLTINCVGRTEPSLAKEHMQGTANAGYVPASETFCSRNPNYTGTIEPGGSHYSWAIFHNVPWRGGEVSLEWGLHWYGVSPWVDPWNDPYPPVVLPPAECPPELVTLKTCTPRPEVPFFCLGEQCNQPRPPSDIPNYPLVSGLYCAADLVPAGLAGRVVTRFRDIVDKGGALYAVIEDVLTQKRYTILLDALQFIPFENCVETIADLLAPGQLDALRACLAARTPEEQMCLQFIMERIGLAKPQQSALP